MTHYTDQREAEADFEHGAYHVRAIAAGIRAGRQISGIGPDVRRFIIDNRTRTEIYRDCKTIIDAFPGQFPLTAERAAE